MICNSGNANTCNADGEEKALEMCTLVEKHMGIGAGEVIVASTGVIGQPLPMEPIRNGMENLVSSLSYEGSDMAAQAIMTTDVKKKELAVSFELAGKTCRMGGICKGSGMIHPNMATMLVFLTTDAAVSSEMLQLALRRTVDDTFNMISVDGDTSTNDMVSVMANGLAANETIICENADFDVFCTALKTLCTALSRMIAADGEGATKLLTCTVKGARNVQDAKVLAKSVISSSLTKAAMFGADANWGRVLCALGYAGVQADVEKISVSFASQAGKVDVCENGRGIDFSEEIAKQVLTCDSVEILVDMHDGAGEATAWGCDLTYDYVKINGDYRT